MIHTQTRVWPGLSRLSRAAAGHLLGIRGRCRACATPVHGPVTPLGLCPPCSQALRPMTNGYCPACGQPDESAATPRLCAPCQQELPPWDALHFWSGYHGLFKELITEFKFRQSLGRQALLADIARSALGYREPCLAELAVPVPLHSRRLGWRGFNQSLELARALPDMRLRRTSLRRVRATTPQVRLTRQERLQNLHGVFAARNVQGHKVLLVDDVMTTGATVRECALALRRGGATRVEVLVLARA